jgi:hypothetical protein
MRPISYYGTDSSRPTAKYCKVSGKKKVVKNVTLTRTADSTEKTYLLRIVNQYNVEISNITINTPDNTDLYGDIAIQMGNCVKVVLKDIKINGTYSKIDKFGYGVSLGNISDLCIKRMYARAKWGVFGNNCICDATLTDCDVNRFDIHCYGRNVKAVNCNFKDGYNQFSSVYGTISFNHCTFTNYVPLLMESSFNAYTPFDVQWNKCTFNLRGKKNYLITLFGVPEAYNERNELKRKCLPNITIKDCTINLADDVDKWYLIETDGNRYKDTFDYISDITVKKVHVNNGKGKVFTLYSEKMKMTNKIRTNIDINTDK